MKGNRVRMDLFREKLTAILIRFRVSILPIAGSEIKNKFESVVVRVLDDRKVITDLDELGLVGYARNSFEKAISKPQGMVILTVQQDAVKVQQLLQLFIM